MISPWRFGDQLLQYHRTVRMKLGELWMYSSSAAMSASCPAAAPSSLLLVVPWPKMRGDASQPNYWPASEHQGPLMRSTSACTEPWRARRNLIRKLAAGRNTQYRGSQNSDRCFAGLAWHSDRPHARAKRCNSRLSHLSTCRFFFETGQRAARLLLKILDGHAKPVTAKVAIPALVRGDELITATGLFGESIRLAQTIENAPGGLSAGMFIGNPFTDVPALQSYSFVVTDNDPQLAEREALRIADSFWKNHEQMFVPLKSLNRHAKDRHGASPRHVGTSRCR